MQIILKYNRFFTLRKIYPYLSAQVYEYVSHLNIYIYTYKIFIYIEYLFFFN